MGMKCVVKNVTYHNIIKLKKIKRKIGYTNVVR